MIFIHVMTIVSHGGDERTGDGSGHVVIIHLSISSHVVGQDEHLSEIVVSSFVMLDIPGKNRQKPVLLFLRFSIVLEKRIYFRALTLSLRTLQQLV